MLFIGCFHLTAVESEISYWHCHYLFLEMLLSQYENVTVSCHVFCRFAKNLNADKINISTLKGEGELSNLELNEEILMQLLDLPSWLILTKAVCNKINVKIQWTKLKSQPICLVSCLKFKCCCSRCSSLFFCFI